MGYQNLKQIYHGISDIYFGMLSRNPYFTQAHIGAVAATSQ